MENYNKIADIIIKRRKQLGIIQSDLSEISGISLRSLKNIETAKGNPTLNQILKILNSLGLEIKITTKNDSD